MKSIAALACLLIVLSLVPAQAQERAQVVDVPSWDTLNMRAEPKEDAPIIRALPSYASNIEVMERRDDWVKVRYFDKEGWVAARFLGASLTYAGNEPPMPLECRGTEPFWSLVFDKKTALYREIGTDIDERLPITDARASRNNLTAWAMTFGRGTVERVVLARDPLCSDGMSDTNFLFNVIVIRRDGEVRSGCCNPPR
ncbi:hypothetical protein GCM10007276_12860 [Agaricicola taiwanensis]|uniref:SH3b domain-containing protein n=1 Tax=Agaricicola taiwanensis TaxID=591372 RepID=A0A8J2VPK3_9RHOB|nr:SH3 domain-containing protein [Agaricicola taiwanensis]GGE36834.1 hypothetical protein GCM10007276_12860 [Agaricicola taiwanensis]